MSPQPRVRASETTSNKVIHQLLGRARAGSVGAMRFALGVSTERAPGGGSSARTTGGAGAAEVGLATRPRLGSRPPLCASLFTSVNRWTNRWKMCPSVRFP